MRVFWLGFREWPARLFVVEWIRIGRAQPSAGPAGDLVHGRGVCGVDWFEGRFTLGTPGFGDLEAGLEGVVVGWIIVRGDVTDEREVFLFASGIGLGNGFREPWLQLVGRARYLYSWRWLQMLVVIRLAYCVADWTESMVTGAPFSENRKTGKP